jgi:uncharacterized protein YjlB
VKVEDFRARELRMSLIEAVKKVAGKLTGEGRPDGTKACEAVRNRKAHTFTFADDGLVPNNPDLPLILYRGPVRLSKSLDPAAMFEELFELNGWSNSWRDGIYDYVHYHPGIHEVLGIARGRAKVQFGGPSGRELEVRAGDVVVLPAGTGHRQLSATKDLLVVGAYPPAGKYEDLRATKEEHDRALAQIPKVAIPRCDPVYGKEGPLLRLWRRAALRRSRGTR